MAFPRPAAAPPDIAWESLDWRAPRPSTAPPLLLAICPARAWGSLDSLFAADEVQRAAAPFVRMRLDPESPAAAGLGERHPFARLPVLLVLAPDGGEIDRITGFLPPPECAVRLGQIARGEGTVAALWNEAARHPDDARFLAVLGGRLADRGDPRSRGLLLRVLALDPQDRSGLASEAYRDLAHLARLQRDDAGAIAPLESLLARFPRSALRGEAWPELARGYRRMHRDSAAVAAWSRAIADAPRDTLRLREAIRLCTAWQVGGDSVAAWTRRLGEFRATAARRDER